MRTDFLNYLEVQLEETLKKAKKLVKQIADEKADLEIRKNGR